MCETRNAPLVITTACAFQFAAGRCELLVIWMAGTARRWGLGPSLLARLSTNAQASRVENSLYVGWDVRVGDAAHGHVAGWQNSRQCSFQSDGGTTAPILSVFLNDIADDDNDDDSTLTQRASMSVKPSCKQYALAVWFLDSIIRLQK